MAKIYNTAPKATATRARRGVAEQPIKPRRARRDWSKIIFYGISILVVISMVLGSILAFIQP